MLYGRKSRSSIHWEDTGERKYFGPEVSELEELLVPVTKVGEKSSNDCLGICLCVQECGMVQTTKLRGHKWKYNDFIRGDPIHKSFSHRKGVTRMLEGHLVLVIWCKVVRWGRTSDLWHGTQRQRCVSCEELRKIQKELDVLHEKEEKYRSSREKNDWLKLVFVMFFYKTITKIMTNDMCEVMGHIISEEQSAFLSSHLITENALIGFELINALKRKNCGDGYYALKFDMSKAYDLSGVFWNNYVEA
uniref:Reverse transcriptase n=1 Tax=Cannabis sativa TaxID=3483 RepID=A0A803PRP0_CANSA